MLWPASATRCYSKLQVFRIRLLPRCRLNKDTANAVPSLHAASARPLQSTVLYFARLGDMIMLTALLNLLHRRYHRPCNVIGAGSWNSGVFLGNPDVARVWSFGRHFPFPLSPNWPAVKRALRDAHHFHLCRAQHHCSGYRPWPLHRGPRVGPDGCDG